MRASLLKSPQIDMGSWRDAVPKIGATVTGRRCRVHQFSRPAHGERAIPISIHLLEGHDAASTARRAVRAALASHPPAIVETAALLTSELVTNALVHAADGATLVIDAAERVAHIEVIDPGHATYLAPLRVEPRSEHGRGLAIVNDLASSWGVESRGPGKAVWFELLL